MSRFGFSVCQFRPLYSRFGTYLCKPSLWVARLVVWKWTRPSDEGLALLLAFCSVMLRVELAPRGLKWFAILATQPHSHLLAFSHACNTDYEIARQMTVQAKFRLSSPCLTPFGAVLIISCFESLSDLCPGLPTVRLAGLLVILTTILRTWCSTNLKAP